MPDNELSLNLNLQKEVDEVRRLSQEFKNLKAIAEDSVASFRSGTGSAANVRQSINAASQAGSGGIQGSAASGSSGGATNASVMAAASVQGRPADVAAYAQFQKQYPGLNPAAYQAAAAQMGVSVGAPTTPSFNANAAMIGIAQTAMSAASGLSFGSGAAMAAASAAAGMGASTLYGGPGNWTGLSATFAAQNANGSGSFSPAQLAFFQSQTNLNNVPVGMANTQRQLMGRMAMSPTQRAGLTAMGMSAGYIGMEGISGGFNLASNATLSGGTINASPMSGMELGGRIGGSMIGLGVGLLSGNPVVAAMAMMGGGEIGASAMRYFGAPMENAKNAGWAMAPFRSSLSGMNRGYTLGGAEVRLEEIQKVANQNFKEGSSFRFDTRAATPDMGKAASSINEGLFLGGIDPYQKANTGRVYSPGIDEIEKAKEILAGRTGATGALRGPLAMAATGIGAVKMISGTGAEQIGDMYLRRVAGIYGAPNVAKMGEKFGPMFASLPSTGGNITDMMAQFGPVAVGAYLRLQNDEGVSSVPSGDLMHNYAAKQGFDRQAALSSLQVTGAGGGIARAMQAKMLEQAKMPGGNKSLEYAQTASNYRAGLSQQFQDDITQKYGMEQLGIQERLAMAKIRPYAPGAVYGEQAAMIRSQRGEAGMISQQIAARKAEGTLSVQEEYSLRARQASANIGAAQGIAEIAEGGANLLMGMGAAMPGGMHRFTSGMQASLFLGRYGSPRRSQGSYNGAHSAAQDDFYDSFDVPSGPYSKTEGVNQFGGPVRGGGGGYPTGNGFGGSNPRAHAHHGNGAVTDETRGHPTASKAAHVDSSKFMKHRFQGGGHTSDQVMPRHPDSHASAASGGSDSPIVAALRMIHRTLENGIGKGKGSFPSSGGNSAPNQDSGRNNGGSFN